MESAKAIIINWESPHAYHGKVNLRFDDTNPVREDDEYVQAIERDIKWLIGEEPNGGIFYGSDYFEKTYELTEKLILAGKAYVCDLSAEQMRQYRGDLTHPAPPAPTATVPLRRTSDCSGDAGRQISRRQQDAAGPKSICPPPT